MADHTPTKVVMYAHATRTAHRIAEFSWTRDTGVTLTILNPDWGRLANE